MDGRRPPPEMSNFYCLPGRAGGTPNVLECPIPKSVIREFEQLLIQRPSWRVNTAGKGPAGSR